MWKAEATAWQVVATAYGCYRDNPDTVPGLDRKMREVLASSEHTDDDHVEENRVRVRKPCGTMPTDRIVSDPWFGLEVRGSSLVSLDFLTSTSWTGRAVGRSPYAPTFNSTTRCLRCWDCIP